MKRLFFIIFLLLPALAFGQSAEVLLRTLQAATPAKIGQLRNVGINGMASFFDPSNPSDKYLFYARNLDPLANYGILRRQLGQTKVGGGQDTAGFVYAAKMYYDNFTHQKYMVGVVDKMVGWDSIAVTPFVDLDKVTQWFDFQTDTSLLKPLFSDPFASGLDDSVSGSSDSEWIHIPNFVSSNSPIDLEIHEDKVIVSDGKNVPYYMTTNSTTELTISAGYEWHKTTPTVVPHQRRSFSLGLEAPGQLRVIPMQNAALGGPKGFYRYKYAYKTGSSTRSAFGPESRTVYADSQRVALTLFELPANNDNTDTSYRVIIYRRRIDTTILVSGLHVPTAWLPWDSLWIHALEYNIYIDTKHDPDSSLPGTFTEGAGVPGPGRFFKADSQRVTGTDTTLYSDSAGFTAYYDSLYYIAYSYYDPYTDIESPMGPKIVDTMKRYIDDTEDTVWIYMFWKGHTKYLERPAYIRIYRSIVNDSSVMYGVLECSANNITSPSGECVPQKSLTWVVRTAADTLLNRRGYIPSVYGDDTLRLAGGDTDLEGILSDSSCGVERVSAYWYTDSTRLRNDAGEAVVRPPNISQLQISFLDVASYAGRLWGIGDDEFSQRLYYSKYEDVSNWSILDYLSLDEDDPDELIALEVADNFEGMYALKKNKIYIISGADPEFDLSYRLLSSGVGGVSRKAITKHRGTIYFLGSDLRLYELSGALNEVSFQVRDTIKGLFVNFLDASRHAVLYERGDAIYVMNDTSGRTFSYTPQAKAWQEYTSTFGAKQIGSFKYDSSSLTLGFGGLNDWVYSDSSTKFLVERTQRYDDTAAPLTDVIFQTQCYGTEEFLTTIQEVSFLAKVADTALPAAATGDSIWLYLKLYDEEGGDSLFVDSVIIDSSGVDQFIVGFPSITGTCLSVRFETDGRELWMNRIRVKTRTEGRVDVQ